MAKKKEEKERCFCRDCAHSFGAHGENHKGMPFMCFCRKSQYKKLLSKEACEEFKMKNK